MSPVRCCAWTGAGPVSDTEVSENQADNIWKPVGDGVWVGSDVSEHFPVYTRGNAGEVYPEVFMPLSFSISGVRSEEAFRHAMLTSGLIRPDELAELPAMTAVGSGVFGGYAYLNLSIQRLIAGRFPGGKATDADAAYLGVGQAPPPEPRDDEKNLAATLSGARYAWRVLRRRSFPELEDDQRRVDAYLRQLPEPDTASEQELRVALEENGPVTQLLFQRHLVISGAAGLAITVLAQLCEKRLDDPDLVTTLLGGLGDVDSAAPSSDLWVLSQQVAASESLGSEFDRGVPGLLGRLTADEGDFLSEFQSFLDRHGARGPNEWDTAFDTWETDPELALTLIDRMRFADLDHDPEQRRKALAEQADEARRAALDQLDGISRRVFSRVLESAQAHSRARERSKTTVIRAIHGARRLAKELDRRLAERSGGQRGDLWFLVASELDDYLADPAGFQATIEERRRLHAELAKRVPPFVFDKELPPIETWELRTASRPTVDVGEVLTGSAGCPGVARGRARVVTDPADPGGLAPGDVLVAPLTDPSWTPLFVPAEAVVVDVGAVMSHAVIVSRELGIPCVVAVTDATKRIPDGAMIEVDGSTGSVTVLSLPTDPV